MWKLLRNLLLAGLLLAGGTKLLAWYEAGQAAQRLTAALAPVAQLTYDSLSAGLDGSVTLGNASLAIKRDKGADTYKAERVVVETPSVFWLLKHSLFGDTALPPHFGISAQGLKLPSIPQLDPHWFDPATLVPFQTAGCAAAAFSQADYRKMDVTPGDMRERGDFHYDAEAHTADMTVVLTAPETASISLEAGLRQFEPNMLLSGDGFRALHIERLAVDYTDNGFFKRRNQFCGQRAGLGVPQFIEQHIAAVQQQLQQHGVEASNEVLKLYRRLVDSGGHATVLSLPNGSFTAGAWWSSSPEDLLRQMNVTTRYGDTPQVMFRLTFVAPPESATAVADVPPVATGAPVAAPPVVATAPAATPPAPTAPIAAAPPPPVVAPPPVAAKPPVVAATTPAPVAVVPDKPSTPVKPAPPVAVAVTTPATATPPASASPRPHTANGLEEVDRAEAKLAPLPKREPPKPVAGATPDFGSSEPPPPANSTLALVWKPTIERLPPKGPEHHDYDIIDFASLKGERGRYVHLITEGGKKVEGYVVNVEEADVELRTRRGGGEVSFVVPKGRIREIRLVHTGTPPA